MTRRRATMEERQVSDQYEDTSDRSEDKTEYKVVVSHEEQYSIWPVDRENPKGWRDLDVSGSKSHCLDYIEQVWTDMRPLSLRRQMHQDQTDPATEED